MPQESSPISLAQVVRRAVEVIDPADTDGVIGDFEAAFEDDDEPVTASGDVQERVSEVLAELDPAVNDGALAMAGAVTVYLSYRRDELHGDPDHLLRLAARAEWNGEPPEVVVEWLADRSITL